MKGCLKLAYSNNRRCPHPRKCVAFCEEGSEEVHVADEWDRTPAPTRRLSYHDILELKEIQRSLPRAEQMPDPLSSKQCSQYLGGVPVALLPLLPETSPSLPPKLPPSPASSPPPMFSASQPSSPTPPPARIYHPPSLAHLPAMPTPRRSKPSFQFLPLLNTPPATPSSSHPPSASNSPPIKEDHNAMLSVKAALESPSSPISQGRSRFPPGYSVPPSHKAIPPEPAPSKGSRPEEQFIIINTVRVPIRELFEAPAPPSRSPIPLYNGPPNLRSSPLLDRDKRIDNAIRRVNALSSHTCAVPLSPPPSPVLNKRTSA